MSKIGDLLNHGQSPSPVAAQAAGAPAAQAAPSGPPGQAAGGPPGQAAAGARPAAAPAPPSAPGGATGGGGGQEMEIERQALERAAAAAPDLDATIRAGLRAIGPESRAAVAGIRGWATAGALDKVAAGWYTKINSIADHVADFEPKLKETARHVEQAEQNTAQLIQRLRAW